jgi:hypothetical protein
MMNNSGFIPVTFCNVQMEVNKEKQDRLFLITCGNKSDTEFANILKHAKEKNIAFKPFL